jgi:hypothetical protein
MDTAYYPIIKKMDRDNVTIYLFNSKIDTIYAYRFKKDRLFLVDKINVISSTNRNKIIYTKNDCYFKIPQKVAMVRYKKINYKNKKIKLRQFFKISNT